MLNVCNLNVLNSILVEKKMFKVEIFHCEKRIRTRKGRGK